MAREDNADERPHLTPEQVNYTHLPEQKMYKVSTSQAKSFEQVENQVRTYPLFITNEFEILYFEIAPSGRIDWHTHTPSFDEVSLCLEGEARYTLEREDGSHQTIEIEPMEFVYLPGGARHKIEATGDHRHTGLVAIPSEPVARLEMLEGVSPYHIDDWPTALWIDRKRDEVVAKDEDAVSE